jgi:hypothetical protein
MISSPLLRELLGDSDTIVVDISGASREVEGLPDDTEPPALVVANVSEAVKQVEDGVVAGYLNRDAMWAVDGFVLSREVVSALPEAVDSAESLIEAVSRAGFRWNVVLPAQPRPPD